MTQTELRQDIANTLASIKEMRASFADVRAAQLKTEAAQLKTDQQLAATRIELQNAQLKTQAELNKLSRDIRNYIGNDAETVEEYFYQTLKHHKRLGKVQYRDIGRNIQMNDQAPEFDVVLYNGDSIGLVEVKKKARVAQVDEMATAKVKAFKHSFPHYADYKFYFALATMTTDNKMIDAAKRAGIYLLTQQGDKLAYLNEEVRVF